MEENTFLNELEMERRKRRRQSYLIALLLFLLLLAVVFSVRTVLFGAKYAYRGKVVDNIILSPKEQEGGSISTVTMGPVDDRMAQGGFLGMIGDGIRYLFTDISESRASAGCTGQTEDEGVVKVDEKRPGDESYVDWTQQASISLFYRRPDEQYNGSPIKPGSKGYYLFRVTNERARDVSVTMTLTDINDVKIPLSVTLIPLDAYGKEEEESVSGSLAGQELSTDTVLHARSYQNYKLEWEWPYESGDDNHDTKLGIEGGQYTVRLTIHAEEQ